MKRYEHGIISSEKPTQLPKPQEALSAVAVVFGTAPVNRLKNPYGATNTPILVSDFDEAIEKVGFSYDFSKYTICQSLYARFKKFLKGPIVIVNVLDPHVHKEEVAATEHTILNKKVLLEEEGILLDKIIVTSSDGITTYKHEEDYITSFTEEGLVNITIIPEGAISASKIKVGYTKIDPSKVTETDIIGGYNASTRKRTGIECVNMVYPSLSVVPCQLLAPGWSHVPTVAAMLTAKAKLINQLFYAIAITDISTEDVTEIEGLLEYKEKNGYDDGFNIACYPKVIMDGYEMYLSAVIDGAIAYTDERNEGPYASPSNKVIPIDSTCMEGGEEIFFDIGEAKEINSYGIMTAINMNGWRSWGNEMACYPENEDVKDRFIVCRRVFNYHDNKFKLDFFDKVDDPTNFRLIEAIVNAENFTLSTLASTGRIAGGSISFNREENPDNQILDGHIKFRRKLSPFTPAKVFEVTTEFDPTLNSAALGGA